MLYSTDTGTELPLLPVATVVFVLGVLDVIDEVPTGFVVLQVALTGQLLAPAAIVQADGDTVSVPVGAVADAVTATDCVPDEQSAVAVCDDDRHTRTLITSVTVPGSMLTVIWPELLIVGVLPVDHTPAPPPTPHLNCTTLPLWKLLPTMVRL